MGRHFPANRGDDKTQADENGQGRDQDSPGDQVAKGPGPAAPARNALHQAAHQPMGTRPRPEARSQPGGGGFGQGPASGSLPPLPLSDWHGESP